MRLSASLWEGTTTFPSLSTAVKGCITYSVGGALKYLVKASGTVFSEGFHVHLPYLFYPKMCQEHGFSPQFSETKPCMLRRVIDAQPNSIWVA
jgi:hypothetical protein